MDQFARNAASAQGAVALTFAHSLAAEAYAQAWQLLSQDLRAGLSPQALEANYREMIAYGEGPVQYIDVTFIMDDWPDRRANDIGWAYASIASDDFSEGVSVVVCDEDGEARIREIEWGRP